MPNYDYKCKECSHTFEVFQSMTAALLKKCPECGGKVQRLIGKGTGIIFKGSGFYATDYKKPEKGKKKEAEKKPEKKPEKKSPDQCKGCDQTSCDSNPQNT